MAINWIANEKIKEADVSIRLYKGKAEQLVFNFTNGVVAVKFNNAEQLVIGYDDELYRLYFAPCETGGYKLVAPNSRSDKKTVKIIKSKFEKLVSPTALCGDYMLNFDANERLYYVDLTETIKFQSKRIKKI